MEHLMTPEKFVAHFAPALQDYLEYQYSKNGHILDLCAASGEFFTVSHHSVLAAMDAIGYTKTTATQDVKTEHETSNNTTEQ